MIVDDDPGILRVVGRMLRDHDAVCVETAIVALARIQQGEEFDVILTDVMMPGMTGVDLYAAILRSHPKLATRVIFMTGGVGDPAISEALATIPNPKLSKPTPVSALLEAVQLAMLA